MAQGEGRPEEPRYYVYPLAVAALARQGGFLDPRAPYGVRLRAYHLNRGKGGAVHPGRAHIRVHNEGRACHLGEQDVL